MDLLDAEDLVIDKMGEYGLLRDGWHFQWDRAKTRAGICSPRQKLIGMSEIVIAINDEAFALDTILHEIAHALVPVNVKAHGVEWKEMAAKLGADPDFSVYDELNRPEPKWVGSCPVCDWECKRYRLKRGMRVTSCPSCSPLVYSEEFNLIWVQNY